MDSNDENDVPKILILGSTGHSQHLTEFLWNEIPEVFNVADYRIVIMDFTVLSDPEVAKSVNPHKSLRDYQFGKLLFSPNSQILVIGSPKFSFTYMGKLDWPGTYWLPKYPRFDYEKGNSVNIMDISFDYYLKHVDSWSYCIRQDDHISNKDLPTYLTEAGVGHKDVALHIRTLAENRYRRPIAFTMHYTVHTYVSGEVIWLPPTTSISTHEAIDLVLKEQYKIISVLNPPDWLNQYPLPREIPIRMAIAQNNEEIRKLTVQTAQLVKTLREETKFHKLLYESGEGILEPIVRAALQDLGAIVNDPKVKGRDDGRLIDPIGREATLEIKGREGQLRLRDINELDRWVRDSLVMEDRRSKGILIGNLKRDQPLNNRENIFPTNCLQAAKSSEICLLTTPQIYKAIQDKQNGKFDQNEFWDVIFSTNGICNLPNPEEKSN